MSNIESGIAPAQSKPRQGAATVPQAVHMAAYEVYCEVFRPQEALVTGWCRGGFSADELVAFLYAKSFPKPEWKTRFDEAIKGLNLY